MSDASRPPAAAATPGIEDWRKLVAEALKGGDLDALRSPTRDGIAIEPLYERRRDVEPLPGRRARPWTIVQAVDDPDPERANAQAKDDIAGGATGLSIRFADAPSAAGYGLPPRREALADALDGVDLAKVHLQLEPHPSQTRSVVWLKVLVDETGVAPELADIAFGLDPVAALADAEQDVDSAQFAGLFSFLRDARFRGPLVSLDARPYHEAGASEAQELAGVVAAAAWWLRELEECEVAPPSEAMPYLAAAISVDRDMFLSIAKLRALRLLWVQLAELCGAPQTPLKVHAETSRRMLTRADPPTNLLRNTIAAFAAGVGGADSVAVAPHTAALGLADRNARALARNIQLLLIEESHLHVVGDPAAGSGAIEALTDALAECSWSEFQAIEREGGIIESLSAGAFQARIAKARAALVEATANGGAPLVGATIHPAPEDAPSVSPPAHAGAPSGLAPMSLEASVKAAA